MSTGLMTGISGAASAALDALGAKDQQQGNSGSKVAGAAKDFEALLLTQILRSSHGEGGWLGTDDDDASAAAVGMGEEQLARTMANNGGLGLAKLIESGIQSRQAAVDSTAAQAAQAAQAAISSSKP